MATLEKYLLMQVPGWVLLTLLLFGLGKWIGLPVWVAALVLIVWVVKDLLLYPILRIAYESNVKTGAEQLIGEKGVAKAWLNPRGHVQVRGELWRAEAEPSDQPISPQSAIEVRAARGLILIVTTTPASRVCEGTIEGRCQSQAR